MNAKTEFKKGSWKHFKGLLTAVGSALPLHLATINGGAQTCTVLHTFTGSDGANPFMAGLVLSGSTAYGTTYSGGSSNLGVVLKVNTDGSGYAVLKNFTGSDGANPCAGLILSGSTLYGTTSFGGSSNLGEVFKVDTDGSGFAVLKNFYGFPDDGFYPQGDLVVSGSTLYGTTVAGGSENAGALFKVNTDGSGYTLLLNFGEDGGPCGGLVLAGGTLYGTTSPNVTSEGGLVFKVNTDGSGYATLKSFSGSDGQWPAAGLVLDGPTLYGTTSQGGSANEGEVFKVNTNGFGFAVLKSFGGSDGALPYARLLLLGSTLYSTTRYGGSSPNGAIFKVNTHGSGFTMLKSFTGSDGSEPTGDLVLSGSTLYGATFSGGAKNDGVIFSAVFLSITAQPLTQTAETGTAPSFSVQAAGPSPEQAYQWFFDGTNALAGATNAVLQLTNVQTAQAGAYTVVVANAGLAVTSTPALLSVIPPVERRPVPAVNLMAQPGNFLGLDYRDNLGPAASWATMTTLTLSNSSQFYFDISVPLPPQRFYRAWQSGSLGVVPSLSLLGMVPAIALTGNIGDSLELDYINQFGPTNAWVVLDMVTLTNTSQLYFDVSSLAQPARLWRIVPVP